MKCFYLLTFFLAIFTEVIVGQCTNTNVVNPTVAKPTAATMVSSTCSTMVVKWTGNPGETYVVSAVRYTPSTNSKDTVSGSPAALISGLDYTSTIAVVPGTQVTWSVQAKSLIAGTTYYSYPLEGTPVNNTILACGVAANTLTCSGRIFLQGAFNATTGTMSNALNTLGILQANASSQPYNTPAFSYAGTENVGAGFFAAHPQIVDWVLMELRDSVVSPSIVSRRAAFVRQDGTLVDIDGTSTTITFNNISPGTYFLSIQHRNHLAVRTRAAIDFNTGTAAYDFTNAVSQSFPGAVANSPVALLNTAVYGLWGGNANDDIGVKMTGINFNSNDYLKLLNVLGSSVNQITNVYSKQDINMDGTVKMTGISVLNNDYLKLLNILGSSVATVNQPIF